jgi:hypothetical protein
VGYAAPEPGEQRRSKAENELVAARLDRQLGLLNNKLRALSAPELPKALTGGDLETEWADLPFTRVGGLSRGLSLGLWCCRLVGAVASLTRRRSESTGPSIRGFRFLCRGRRGWLPAARAACRHDGHGEPPKVRGVQRLGKVSTRAHLAIGEPDRQALTNRLVGTFEVVAALVGVGQDVHCQVQDGEYSEQQPYSDPWLLHKW